MIILMTIMVIQRLIADFKGSNQDWLHHWYKTYEFNQFGNITKIAEFEGADGGWSSEAIAVTMTDYDEEQRVVLYEKIAPTEWGEGESFKNVFEYDTYDNLTKEEHRNGWPGNYRYGNMYERAYIVIEMDNSTYERRTLDAHYVWDVENQAWVGNYKYEYDYDEEGRYTLNSYVSNWESETNSYGYRYIYNYDEDGNRIRDKREDYISKAWVNNRDYQYEFDEMGNRTKEIYQSSWNVDNEYYSYGNRYYYVYNNDGFKTQQEYAYLSEGMWIKSSKNDFSYSDEIVVEEIYSYWSTAEDKYILSTKYTWEHLNDSDYNRNTYTYDSPDWILTSISSVRKDFEQFTRTETVYGTTTDEKNYEYKTWYTDHNFSNSLKYSYTNFNYPQNNRINIYERHFNQSSLRNTYDLVPITGTDSLVHVYKNTLVIEEKGDNDLLLSRTYFYNEGSSSEPIWVESEKYEYEYIEGIQSGITQYDHDGTDFYGSNKYNMTYSEEEEEYTDISSSWNGTEFVNEYKREFVMDDNNLTTSFADYYWNSDDEIWVGNYRYDRLDSLDDEGYYYYGYADYYWDNQENQWNGSYAYEYKEDPNGNRVLNLNYEWNSEEEEWDNYFKNEMTWNDDGSMMSEARYGWNSEKDIWIGSQKNEYDGDRTAYYSWKYSDGTWVYNYANTYTVDGNTSSTMTERWYIDAWFNESQTIKTVSENSESDEYYFWLASIDDWSKFQKNTKYENEEGMEVLERASGYNGEWLNHTKETLVERYSDDYGSYSLKMFEKWRNDTWQIDRLEENMNDYYDWTNSFFATYLYNNEAEEFVPHEKRTNNNWIYTWNDDLEDWLGIRYIPWANFNERWDVDTEEWVLNEKAFYIYSPIISYDIP